MPVRILVVEDEDLIRELLVEFLADAGFEVDQASNGDDAARLIEADGCQLLVTDVHMPGKLNGLELAERAGEKKARNADCSGIRVSGRHRALAPVRAPLGGLAQAVRDGRACAPCKAIAQPG